MRRRSWLAGAAACLAPTVVRADIPRMKTIRERAQPRVRALFEAKGIDYPAMELHLRAFKREGVLQMWGGNVGEPLTLVKAYPICARSGTLGPKRQQGDLQVPEGFYEIHRYNAWSAYHMSLRVNYPNPSDAVRGVRGDLGGAIMVHGDCVTIGCIPIEDRPIEEVFLSVLDTRRAARRQVPIHIFPGVMDDEGWGFLETFAADRPDLLAFWRELAPAYREFEAQRQVPAVDIDERTGTYTVATSAVKDFDGLPGAG